MKPSAHELREAVRMLERRLGLLNQLESSCCGVTFSQCHAVVEIGRSESLSLNALASRLMLDKSTMSRTLQNLVENGLAARTDNPSDRRYVTISLTDKGKTTFEAIETSMNSYFASVFERIPEEKRTTVVESMNLLLDALSDGPPDTCSADTASGGRS